MNSLARAKIKQRDGRKCVKCGATSRLEIHHIEARLNGGNDEPDNLITLCTHCHLEWHRFMEPHFVFRHWVQLPPAWKITAALFSPTYRRKHLKTQPDLFAVIDSLLEGKKK